MRQALFRVLAAAAMALATLSPTPLSAQTAWLEEWPTPEQVQDDIIESSAGEGELIVVARQTGRLRQLMNALDALSGGGKNSAPDVAELRADYEAADAALIEEWGPELSDISSQHGRNAIINAENEYLQAEGPAREAAELYFTPEVKSQYVSLVWDGTDPEPLPEGGLMPAIGSLISGTWPILILLFIVGIIVLLARRSRGKAAKRVVDEAATVEQLLSQFGATAVEREAGINKAFDKKEANIDFHLNWSRKRDWQADKKQPRIKCHMRRSLASMPPREREALRSVLLLRNAGLHVEEHNTWMEALALVYGDGKATIFDEGRVRYLDSKSMGDNVKWLIGDDNAETMVNFALSELTRALVNNPDNPMLNKLGARLLGGGGDLDTGGALTASSLDDLPAQALIIGGDERDQSKLWTFSGQGSLITIAPPGSGKTQCHVIPNLLTWPGPAVVLDIKGEIFAATSGWRRANVGPVYKFSPLDPGNGHCYNPLLAAAEDPDHIWEDSRFLADMLIVPGGKSKDPFWESRARDVLTAAIAVTVRNRPRAERTMGEVLEIMHGVGWDRFIISLQATSDVPTMARSGRSLGEMETKTRDSVLQTALASLSAWDGTRITRATATSDWEPADLRGDANPTIYICIKPDQIDSYASMLRVVIAQHIRVLASSLPEREAHPILFVLDELPRLRHMPPVEEALEIGRGYGIKLWMFTQTLGQLENAYDNAEGMVGSCAVRMFMNPPLHDGTAQKLSDDMGYVESVIDGSRVKRVEPNVLGGPTFANKVIVMAANAEPGAIAKHFAHSDPELAARMAIAPAEVTKECSHGG